MLPIIRIIVAIKVVIVKVIVIEITRRRIGFGG